MNVEVSSSFKKKTKNAILAILGFVLFYLLLIILAVGFTILCIAIGIGIILAKPMIITIGLGIGIISLGVFILMFLFKFLFKKYVNDRSHLLEITKEDEPELFQFIDEIVKEVETDFPKKIYVSGDVNASVFYDSSFWSMILPIRKNLQIGLGLVNSITDIEFKAILAHEFGHFSQRSMKVGSYVYNLNQIIYNMLYENDSFEIMIQNWANISGYFSFFVSIAVKIIRLIQKLLQKMYEFVNIHYMALSREMEFHADEVAAHVAGSAPLINALLRVELADHSYNSVLNFYGQKIADNIKSNNIYLEQKYVLNFIASDNNIPINNDLPSVTESDLNKYNKSKLNIKNQWASHPTTPERIKALELINIAPKSLHAKPAFSLFAKREALEEKITDLVFSKVDYPDKTSKIDFEHFKNEFTNNYNVNSFPKIYNGYYDNKNTFLFEIDSISMANKQLSIENLFNNDMVETVYEYISLEGDKDIISKISTKEIDIKTYDYNGQKYKADDSTSLLQKLEKDATIKRNELLEHDIKIYTYFLNLAISKNKSDEFKQKYVHLFNSDKDFTKKQEFFNLFIDATKFLSVVTPNDIIVNNFKEIAKLEIELKKDIQDYLNDPLLTNDINKEMRLNLENYLSKNLVYFSNDLYVNENIQLLSNVLNHYVYLISRKYFVEKLQLLHFQYELI